MFNFFHKFGSCCRLPQRRRPATTTDDSFLCHVGTSGDCHRMRDNRSYGHRKRPSGWRPALSVIVEDRVDQHHDVSVDRKSKESSGKNKSVANVGVVYQYQEKKRRRKPKLFVSPFAATPYMF